jgi:hypothetical protein
MIKIKEITICLHCGCSSEIIKSQMNELSTLSLNYKLYWNNRIDRHPGIYESYSELINHSVVTSNTEWIILINDRAYPTVDEVEKMIKLLENGYACVFLYNVGFMGFSKELIRQIGWWDQRYINGGWEDVDWVIRIKKFNFALYESQESSYDYTWKSPLNIPGAILSTQFWYKKYRFESDGIYQLLADETYNYNIGKSNSKIVNSWMIWDKSKLNIMYDKLGSGSSGSSIINNREIKISY